MATSSARRRARSSRRRRSLNTEMMILSDYSYIINHDYN
jgi:hypothetical protein